MIHWRSLALVVLLVSISSLSCNGRPEIRENEESGVGILPAIQFAGIPWSAPEQSVRDTLANRGFEFTYVHEDGTLVYYGPVFGIQGSGVFAYFSNSGDLVRINILLDESDEETNVKRFLEVRSDFIESYSEYKRIFSPAEENIPGLDQMDETELATLVREDDFEVWSAWSHKDAEGNRSRVEIWLKKLSDTPPWPSRLVTRIWYYSPLWLEDHDEG